MAFGSGQVGTRCGRSCFMRAVRTGVAVSVVLAVIPLQSALADGGKTTPYQERFRSSSNMASKHSAAPVVDCTCRHRGEDFHIGETICIRSAEGLNLAVCSMVLNNTSWKVTRTPCPSS